ncbi:hypothetical protein LOTGIDRAFT_239042 [Lottia gigantea]|uniref:HMG box domain-containing protein n=1 Tax=Lottia gigantea TaxID=225164 RepID=V4AMX9_LOTGI|nr:hypothetical protein LOTGIDRAFT_239042 [Lottia gigantea]ESO98507.1 hypothetical protein LOTGIDRAFT_239042 [Lottia gigantea]
MAEELEATLAVVRQETAFLEKYFGLRKRCEQMQQANEKMVNRLQHVKKIIKRHKREKRFLESRLAEYGDNYKESQVPLSWEEDQLFNCLRPTSSEPPPYPKSDCDDDMTTKTTAMSSIQPYLQKSTKSRKSKSDKEKDPNAPKKPSNVFQIYCKEQKQKVQAVYFQEFNEEIAHHELTRRLAQKWHVMSQEEKKMYYEMHDIENERYQRELKVYENREITEPTTSNMAANNFPSQLGIKEEME